MKYLASTKLQPTMRTLYFLIFVLWSLTSYTQSTKDSLSELQSILDSIPDISLAELGIDTTAEIVPDTLHLVIPASIASDTTFARTCLNQAIDLIKIGKYDIAYAKADTAKHIYQMNIGYVTKEVADCLHQMGRSLHFGGKYDEAFVLNRKNLILRMNLFGEENTDVALSYNLIGASLNSKGNYDKALGYMYKALKIKIAILGLEHSYVGQTYFNLYNSYYSKGEYDKALEFIHKYLDNCIVSYGSKHPIVGQAYQYVAGTYYLKGAFAVALEFSQKGLQIILLTYDINHRLVGGAFQNLGIIYNSQGDYNKALEFTKKCIDNYIISYGVNHPSVGQAYQNLGVTYYHIGELNKALEFNKKCIYNYILSYGENHRFVGQAYQNLASILHSNKQVDKAIEYFTKAMNINISSIGPNHPFVGQAYQGLANTYNSKGEYETALNYAQKCLNNYIVSYGINHPFVGQAFGIIGNIYIFKAEFDKALDYTQKSLDNYIISYGINHPFVGQAYGNIGRIYYEKGDYSKASKYFNLGGNVLLKTVGINHQYSIYSLHSFSKLFYKMNVLDSSLYFLKKALTNFKDQMSSDISTETKTLYQSQKNPIFESAIDVSLIKSKQDQHDSLKLKTYEYTELAKASLLQSQIKQTDALAFAGIPDSLLQKEYDIRIHINWREKQRQGLLEKGKSETDTTVLRISSIIFDLKREQEALFETLEKDYPEYYRLKYDTKTISLENTQQKLLQKDQTMLEYFVGDSSIFIFVVRPDTFDVVQVKKDFTLDSLVRQMQSGLYGYYGLSRDQRTDDLYKKSITDYTNAAHELYNRIVAPVAHLLTPDLVIIPDGVLGYVPFEALLKSKPEKLNQFAAYPYMINDQTISYNYSATLWQEMKNKKHKKEPSKSLIAFAPFYEGSYTVLDSTISLVFDTLPDGRDTTIFQDIVSRKTYAPLPSSGIEAGTVSKMWKGDFFINQDATEQRFYDIAGDYRFVHLSTHGVADARQGDYSYLAFAEQKDSIENEFLYVRDIYNTQLNADLVFLSACETAQGELQRGEGIISLARAFAYAGAKSIITTLWQVDDAATKDISIEFYKNLKKGLTKDVALRQAKLRHIKSAKSAQKHPFFWAAMIGIGDMGVVR